VNTMQQALMKAKLVTEKQIKNADRRCDLCNSKMEKIEGKFKCQQPMCNNGTSTTSS
jgi:hypothetical protein